MNKRSLLCFMLALLVVFTGCTKKEQYDDENDFIVEVEENGIKITGYSGSKTEIRIPPSIQDLPVITIGAKAFAGHYEWDMYDMPIEIPNTNLVSVTIPNSVTAIEERAFFLCPNLTSVTLGDNVSAIGRWAFKDCAGLASVTIPNSVTSIDDAAFQGTGLTSITFGGSDTAFHRNSFNVKIDGVSFAGDLNDKYAEGGTGTYTASINGWNLEWTK